jgi:hypothetical protein
MDDGEQKNASPLDGILNAIISKSEGSDGVFKKALDSRVKLIVNNNPKARGEELHQFLLSTMALPSELMRRKEDVVDMYLSEPCLAPALMFKIIEEEAINFDLFQRLVKNNEENIHVTLPGKTLLGSAFEKYEQIVEEILTENLGNGEIDKVMAWWFEYTNTFIKYLLRHKVKVDENIVSKYFNLCRLTIDYELHDLDEWEMNVGILGSLLDNLITEPDTWCKLTVRAIQYGTANAIKLVLAKTSEAEWSHCKGLLHYLADRILTSHEEIADIVAKVAGSVLTYGPSVESPRVGDGPHPLDYILQTFLKLDRNSHITVGQFCVNDLRAGMLCDLAEACVANMDPTLAKSILAQRSADVASIYLVYLLYTPLNNLSELALNFRRLSEYKDPSGIIYYGWGKRYVNKALPRLAEIDTPGDFKECCLFMGAIKGAGGVQIHEENDKHLMGIITKLPKYVGTTEYESLQYTGYVHMLFRRVLPHGLLQTTQYLVDHALTQVPVIIRDPPWICHEQNGGITNILHYVLPKNPPTTVEKGNHYRVAQYLLDIWYNTEYEGANILTYHQTRPVNAENSAAALITFGNILEGVLIKSENLSRENGSYEEDRRYYFSFIELLIRMGAPWPRSEYMAYMSPGLCEFVNTQFQYMRVLNTEPWDVVEIQIAPDDLDKRVHYDFSYEYMYSIQDVIKNKRNTEQDVDYGDIFALIDASKNVIVHYVKFWEDAMKNTDEWWYECKNKDTMRPGNFVMDFPAPYIEFMIPGGSSMLFPITVVVCVLKELKKEGCSRIFQYNNNGKLNYTTKLKLIQNKLYQSSHVSANHCQDGSDKPVGTIFPCTFVTNKRQGPPYEGDEAPPLKRQRTESYSSRLGPRCNMCSKKMRRKVKA